MTWIEQALAEEREIVGRADDIADRLYCIHDDLRSLGFSMKEQGYVDEASRVRSVALVFKKLGLEVDTWDLTVSRPSFLAED